MKSLPLRAGRRAAQLVPALAAQAVLVQPEAMASDLKLFAMTLSGGLVFFGTFFG